jgi:glycerol uptake operon antiterminator
MLLNKAQMPVVIRAMREPGQEKQVDRAQGNAWIFLLGGSIEDAAESVACLQKKHWVVFVHVDMIKGITNDYQGVRVFQEFARPDGIITTHAHTVGHAKKLAIPVIQRIFLLDSLSVESGLSQVMHSDADAVEVLPGILPEAIAYLSRRIPRPLIAGGLIKTDEEVRAAIQAGATSVSSSTVALSEKIWTRADFQRRAGAQIRAGGVKNFDSAAAPDA